MRTKFVINTETSRSDKYFGKKIKVIQQGVFGFIIGCDSIHWTLNHEANAQARNHHSSLESIHL